VVKSKSLEKHLEEQIGQRWRKAPFVLRITEWRDVPKPVLVVKERRSADRRPGQDDLFGLQTVRRTGALLERGHISGRTQRRVLPILRKMVESVSDEVGSSLELPRFLSREGLALRVNLPLNEEAGAKLSLLFKLQERMTDLDRVELMARRISRFTREEAVYWHSRTTSFGDAASRWAISGMRILLGGNSKDSDGVAEMLQRLQMEG
jgi:hypothetical protein